MMIDAEAIVTPALSDAFLHGVTRDSILTLAADLGYTVDQQDELTVDTLLEWSRNESAEAALSGTAAVLAAVGALLLDGVETLVGTGGVGEHTMRLRTALTDLHIGAADDRHGWLTRV
jgi:branched-chain amino acid aminotransferase